MPKRFNSKSDIGTSKVASDSYDNNNIFLTDQGWVYRHFKGNPADDNVRYWDEILVAGAVDATANTAFETLYDGTGGGSVKYPAASSGPGGGGVGYEPNNSGFPDGIFDVQYAKHLTGDDETSVNDTWGNPDNYDPETNGRYPYPFDYSGGGNTAPKVTIQGNNNPLITTDVTYSAVVSNDPGSITTFDWVLTPDDASKAVLSDADQQTCSVNYVVAGSFTLKVTSTFEDGTSKSDTMSITSFDDPADIPAPSFDNVKISPDSGTYDAGDTQRLRAIVTPGPIAVDQGNIVYDWSFNSAEVSLDYTNTAEVIATFNKEADVTISVTVSDIATNASPVSDFGFYTVSDVVVESVDFARLVGPDDVVTGTDYQYTAEAGFINPTSSPVEYKWEVTGPDAVISDDTVADPTITFNTDGDYQVTYTAKSATGLEAKPTTKDVTAVVDSSSLPDAPSFDVVTIDPATGSYNVGETIQITADVVFGTTDVPDDNIAYAWTFNASVVSLDVVDAKSVNATFIKAGTATVRVNVSDKTGIASAIDSDPISYTVAGTLAFESVSISPRPIDLDTNEPTEFVASVTFPNGQQVVPESEIEYTWSVYPLSANEIKSGKTDTITFTAEEARSVINVIATDRRGIAENSVVDSITIDVHNPVGDPINDPPDGSTDPARYDEVKIVQNNSTQLVAGGPGVFDVSILFAGDRPYPAADRTDYFWRTPPGTFSADEGSERTSQLTGKFLKAGDITVHCLVWTTVGWTPAKSLTVTVIEAPVPEVILTGPESVATDVENEYTANASNFFDNVTFTWASAPSDGVTITPEGVGETAKVSFTNEVDHVLTVTGDDGSGDIASDNLTVSVSKITPPKFTNVVITGEDVVDHNSTQYDYKVTYDLVNNKDSSDIEFTWEVTGEHGAVAEPIITNGNKSNIKVNFNKSLGKQVIKVTLTHKCGTPYCAQSESAYLTVHSRPKNTVYHLTKTTKGVLNMHIKQGGILDTTYYPQNNTFAVFANNPDTEILLVGDTVRPGDWTQYKWLDDTKLNGNPKREGIDIFIFQLNPNAMDPTPGNKAIAGDPGVMFTDPHHKGTFAGYEMNTSGWDFGPSTDVSRVRNMYGLFKGNKAFNSPSILDWDVSDVLNMAGMFESCLAFNQPVGLYWDTENCTEMSSMFKSAATFNQPFKDANGNTKFTVKKVNSLLTMFAGGYTGDDTGVGIAGIVPTTFNQDLSHWDISNVYTYWKDGVGNWVSDKAIGGFMSMFAFNHKFNNGGESLAPWGLKMDIPTPDMTDNKGQLATSNMETMFDHAHEFKGLGLETWANASNHWNNVERMFREANAFEEDISGWFNEKGIGGRDPSSDRMKEMFLNTDEFDHDLTGWCVNFTLDRPDGFADGSKLQLSHEPIWGTCPGDGLKTMGYVQIDTSALTDVNNTEGSMLVGSEYTITANILASNDDPTNRTVLWEVDNDAIHIVSQTVTGNDLECVVRPIRYVKWDATATISVKVTSTELNLVRNEITSSKQIFALYTLGAGKLVAVINDVEVEWADLPDQLTGTDLKVRYKLIDAPTASTCPDEYLSASFTVNKTYGNNQYALVFEWGDQSADWKENPFNGALPPAGFDPNENLVKLLESNGRASIDGIGIARDPISSETGISVEFGNPGLHQVKDQVITIIDNPNPAINNDVTFELTGAQGTSSYTSVDGDNASTTIEVGGTLTIVNNSGGHPVDIQDDNGDQVTEGTLTGAPANNGSSVTWDTTGVTPGTYYYQCTAHSAMKGQIIVTA